MRLKKYIKVFNGSKYNENQKFIKNNFQYVADNFRYEARSIHYGKKEKKNIYGSASLKDIKELKEEGIDTDIVPWVKNFDN